MDKLVREETAMGLNEVKLASCMLRKTIVVYYVEGAKYKYKKIMTQVSSDDAPVYTLLCIDDHFQPMRVIA